MSGSPVSWRTSQLWATVIIQVPTSEISLAGEEQPVVAVAERACAAERAPERAARTARDARPRRPDVHRARSGCARTIDPGSQLGAVVLEVRATRRGGVDHRLEPPDLRPQRGDLAIDPLDALREERAPLPGSSVSRKRAPIVARAFSSSSSWPISARLKPASSRRPLMNSQALDVVLVVEAVRADPSARGFSSPISS